MPAKPPNTTRTGHARGAKPVLRRVLRGVLGTGLLLAALATGHALLWRWMGGQLQDGFDAWMAARRAQGWQVDHAAPRRGGWPSAATLTLPRFALAGGVAGGGVARSVEWQAEALVLRVALARPDRLAVEMPGRHLLRLGPLELPLTADRLAATLPLERDVPPGQATLEAGGLRLDTAAGPLEIRAARLEVETRTTAGKPAVVLRLTADQARLPDGALAAGNPLGRELRSVALDLVLTGPVPPSRDPARRAAAWRDGGGALEIRSAGLCWGAVAASATATLALDAALQPMGAGTLRLVGGAEALSAAAAAGLLAPGAVAGGRLLLALFARTPPEGGPARLDVPLTLEDRSLSVARVPLLRLPAWNWLPAESRPLREPKP